MSRNRPDLVTTPTPRDELQLVEADGVDSPGELQRQRQAMAEGARLRKLMAEQQKEHPTPWQTVLHTSIDSFMAFFDPCRFVYDRMLMGLLLMEVAVVTLWCIPYSQLVKVRFVRYLTASRLFKLAVPVFPVAAVTLCAAILIQLWRRGTEITRRLERSVMTLLLL